MFTIAKCNVYGLGVRFFYYKRTPMRQTKRAAMRMVVDHLRIVARRLFILKNYGYTLKIAPYYMYRGSVIADFLRALHA